MSERLEESKAGRALAVQIYKAVRNRGCDFPQKLESIAVILAEKEIDWQQLGHKKMHKLFEDLPEYYTVHTISRTEMLVDDTEALRRAAEENRSANSLKTSVLAEYFSDGIQKRRIWKKELTEEIYCFHNWDKTTAMLAKITGIYDLSPEGWLHILAFSYHRAAECGALMQNRSENYLCYDTGLTGTYGDKIYLLAGENSCKTPQWILLGLTTVNSRFLGGILKSEFRL